MKFTHDVNSASDIKMEKLIVKYGMLGYGTFWFITEQLYGDQHAMLDITTDALAALAKKASLKPALLKEIINYCIDLKLWHYDTGYIYSIRVNETISKIKDTTKKRSAAGKLGAMARNNVDIEAAKDKVKKLLGEIKDDQLLPAKPVPYLFDVQRELSVLQQEALNDNDFILSITQLGCPAENISMWLNRFTKEQMGDGNKKMSEREYRRYFRNWLNKKDYMPKVSSSITGLTNEQIIEQQKQKYQKP